MLELRNNGNDTKEKMDHAYSYGYSDTSHGRDYYFALRHTIDES